MAFVTLQHGAGLVRTKTENYLDWLMEFCNRNGAQGSHISALGELKYALENGRFDIFHISTHGRYDKHSPSDSSIYLQDNKEFRINDLVGKLTRIRLTMLFPKR